MSSNNDQLTSAKDALLAKAGENGARGASRAERNRLRTEEQASIQQAIATLTSDDARDLFKRSFDSQGATFLQTHLKAVRKHGAGKAKQAARVLRRTGVQAGDLRLVTLASKVEKGKQTPTDFSAVTKDLEDMLADLVKEEKDDATE